MTAEEENRKEILYFFIFYSNRLCNGVCVGAVPDLRQKGGFSKREKKEYE